LERVNLYKVLFTFLRMKKGVITFVFVLFFIGFVSAANSCIGGANQVIFKISDDTNAHGERYNGAGSYGTEVCYNQLFADPSGPGANPWACDGGNKLLGLSAISNAHAQNPSLSNYGVNVCFRDMTCSLKASCGPNEAKIVRLFDVTNSHLEIGKGTAYNNVLCCSVKVGGVDPPLPICNPSCDPLQVCEGNPPVCVNPPTTPMCGNNAVDVSNNEECDGNNFGGLGTAPVLCSTHDSKFTSGNLQCINCKIDTTSCVVSGSGGGVCGDGNIDSGEQCDDSNTAPTDGCDGSCQIEPGFGCVGEPSVCNPITGGTAFWADSQDKILITEAIVGDTVLMIANNVVPPNAVVTFEISDDDGLSVQEIRTVAVRGVITATAVGGVAEGSVIFDEFDYSNGLPESGNPPELDLFFVAKVGDGSGYSETSDILLLGPDTDETVVTVKDGCGQFNDDDKDTCESAGESIWKADEIKIEQKTGAEVGCGEIIFNTETGQSEEIRCSCNWDEKEGTVDDNDDDLDKCEFRSVGVPIGTTDGDALCYPSCDVGSYSEECLDSGFRDVFLTASFEAEDRTCPIVENDFIRSRRDICYNQIDGGSYQELCASPQLQLPFFGVWQLFGSMMAILMVYLVMGMRRRVFK
jgi:cysteine-rich repeat protein